MKDVAELLKVKDKTIYQWAELCQIPSMKINGCLRFQEDEVMSWLESCKKAPTRGTMPSIRMEARKGGDRA